MTVAEIIADQKRKCEVSKAARKAPPVPKHPASSAPTTKKLGRAEVERAYIEDRIYDGKVPEGGMAGIMRRENPGEYVGRDGTKTFCPWRYVSMQDIELPDNGNPYRKKETEEPSKKNYDPWGRPSGYLGSAGGPGGISPEYDPWANPGMSAQQSTQAPPQDASWDDWLAPAPAVPPPPPPPTGFEPAVGTPDISSRTLDLMRSMR